MDNSVIITNGSDIFIEVSFAQSDGSIAGIPLYDFDIEFYGCLNNKVVASKHGDVFDHCEVVGDNKLRIAIDEPNFGKGALWRRAKLHIPDMRFKDGVRTVVSVKKIADIR